MLECQLKDRVGPEMSANEHPDGKGLVVFPGALGDFLCFLPTLKVISEHHQGSHIEIVMRSDFSDLLGNPRPEFSVRSLDNHEIGRLFADGAADVAELKSKLGPWDFIYSWFGAHDRNFVKNLKTFCDGDYRIFPFRPFHNRIHLMDYYGSCLDVRYPAEQYPKIPLTCSAIAWTKRYWSEHKLWGGPVLAIAPGSGAREKSWDLSYYMDVIRWWKDRTHGKVLVILGPAEEGSQAQTLLGGHAIVARHLAVGQVAALFAQCHVYLGNDSGITHLASAVGVNTIALFGPTDPVQWRPRGKRVEVVRQGVECSPCNEAAMRSCVHLNCLSHLSPGTVIEVLNMMFAEGCLDKDRIEL